MAQLKWVPGKHYTIVPQQRSLVPAGKVEVLEVFSYGCPACNQFRTVLKQLSAALPKNAQIAYLPASWQTAENWPTFQRAYLTALSLGIADKAHEGMYNAIWTTGELGITDPNTRQLKKVLPSMDDIAKFYERTTGVKAQDFVNASKSFGVDLKIKQAEAADQGHGNHRHADVGRRWQVPHQQRVVHHGRRDHRAGELPGCARDARRGRKPAAAPAKPAAAPAKPSAAPSEALRPRQLDPRAAPFWKAPRSLHRRVLRTAGTRRSPAR